MHNPKVGGTSVRQALEHFGDTEPRFYAADPDPESPLHQIDRAHMGIDEFAHHFPDTWDQAKSYPFYALWRAPKDRILSSVNEYSRRFAETDIRFVDSSAKRDFLFRTLDQLAAHGRAEDILDHFEFTHFRPQWIYCTAQTADIDMTLIPLSETDRLYAEIGARTGEVDLGIAHQANPSEQISLPGGLARFASSRRLRTLVTEFPGLSRITPMIRRFLLARQPQQSAREAFALSEADKAQIGEFVADFYHQDFKVLPL